MKIALLGEYSSLYNNLAKGLNTLGHQTILVNDGDSFKNYYRDINLAGITSNKLINHTSKIIKQTLHLSKLKNYDIVSIINPLVLSRFGPAITLYKLIKKNNKKIFLSAVGDDYFLYKAIESQKFRYFPPILLQNKKIWQSKRVKNINKYLAYNANAVIAGSVEYYIAYINVTKNLHYIPFPIYIKDFNFTPLTINKHEKIKIFHGVQKERIFFKGSNIIDQAMKELQYRYPSDIEYIRVENMPYKDYINAFNASHVLIDQTWSYSPGMNALAAMAKGKVVMGGFEKECIDINKIDEVPMINILPSKESIQSKIIELLNKRHLIEYYSCTGRKYIEENHDAGKVARTYIDVWNQQ